QDRARPDQARAARRLGPLPSPPDLAWSARLSCADAAVRGMRDQRSLPVEPRVNSLQHPQSRSFELVADLYERARPEYPPEAVAWVASKLGLDSGSTI